MRCQRWRNQPAMCEPTTMVMLDMAVAGAVAQNYAPDPHVKSGQKIGFDSRKNRIGD